MPIQPADIRFDKRGNALSGAFNDIYFNPGDAAGKTTHIFHRATHFAEQCAELRDGEPMAVGELGFGLGLNFLGTWAAFNQLAPPRSRLHYVGIELAPPSAAQLRRAWGAITENTVEADALIAAWPGRVAGVHRVELARCSLTLHFGDVAEMLPGLSGGGPVDAWFLDGFAPEKNPAMWSAEVAQHLFRLTRTGGRLGSFTAAGHVRRALADAGFAVERLPGDPFKRHIVAAQKPAPGRVQREAGKKKIVVVGAGWAGLSVAEALHGRGHEVVVVDAEGPGAGASGNRQAVCAPVLDAAASPRQDFYRSAFVHASGLHERCGVLRRPDTQKSAAALRQAAEVFGALDDWFTAYPPPPEAHAPSEVPEGSNLAPGESPGAGSGATHEDSPHAPRPRRPRPRVIDPGLKDDGGLWISTAGVARFANFAAQVCAELPASAMCWPFEVVRIERAEDSSGNSGQERLLWRVRSVEGETLEADAVVLACAAAVRRFGPTADWPLRRIRGQVTHVPATRESAAWDHIVVGEAYLCPADDGRHSVGATFDPDDNDPNERAADHADNHRRALATAPSWAAAMDWSETEGRVGFRVNTPDYLPMIGPVPDVPGCQERVANTHDAGALKADDMPTVRGLYAVTALGSHGVITSALAGPLIADLIEGTALPCSTQAYAAVHPARYLLRAAKRREFIDFPALS